MPTRLGNSEVEKVFNRFVAAINDHDAEALGSLMTPDHLFIDSLGNRVQGAVPMQAGWSGYFALCPDYRVTVETVLTGMGIVLATGEAGGTIDDIEWRTPAAWQAVIRGEQVAEWRVFADNKPVYEILARRAKRR